MNDFDTALIGLRNAARKLNSSFHVTRAAIHLEEIQKGILILFRLNAQSLVPTGFYKEAQLIINEALSIEELPKLFSGWAEYMDHFVDSVKKLPGHTDKDISKQMLQFVEDLKVI